MEPKLTFTKCQLQNNFGGYYMIIDITGTELIPGNCGYDCPGNGLMPGVECCCDECDYMMCCLETHDSKECLICNDKDCPRAGTANSSNVSPKMPPAPRQTNAPA